MTTFPDETIIVTTVDGLTIVILTIMIIGTSEKDGTGAATTMMIQG